MGTILSGREVKIFDSVSSDMAKAAGEEINYYSLNSQDSKYDPLYGEYENRAIDGPWKIFANFSWPQQTPMSADSGYTVVFAGKVVLNRSILDEHNAPYPIEGDVIEAWRTPYHDIDSMGKGLFFDIVKVDNDGHLNDSPTFVQFICTLKRNPQFAAERRILPP